MKLSIKNRYQSETFLSDLLLSANERIIFGVRANPEPTQLVNVPHRQSTVMQSHAHRPELTHRFEVERRMIRVAPQKCITTVGLLLNLLRQPRIARPELRCRVVPHNSVHRPPRRSANASAASASNRPASASASISLSQVSESKRVNQARNTASSSGGSFSTARSISRIVLMVRIVPERL